MRGLPSLAERHESSSSTAVIRGYDPRKLLGLNEPLAPHDGPDTEVDKETLADAWTALVPVLLVELRSVVAARMVPMRTVVLLTHVDGTSTVASIVEASGQSRDVVVRTFMELEANGLVKVG
mgnify:CR=1 FL=1